jgi:HK97 family phage prohead protease
MSETETEHEIEQQPETETVIDQTIRRTFAASLEPGDGRTVDCRIVPYGEQIEHNDGLGGLPVGMPYKEEWMLGAFSGQERAANRVLANVEHEQGVAGIVGHGVMLREQADGFYGSFKIHDDAAGDKALLLIKEKVLTTVSLEARARKTVRTRDGVIRRVKAHLRGIAFARFGAYDGAAILAVRAPAIDDEVVIDEALLALPIPAETIERCRRLGLALPSRYQAHPDTPDETGTSAPAGEDETTSTEGNDAADTE